MNSLLEKTCYQFIQREQNLGKHILYLTLSGSIGYGTNTEQSDVDLRGFAIERSEVFWGLESFEQFEDAVSDTVIYSLKKFVNLALKGNPNILELLGTNDEHIVYMHPLGKRIRENRHLFLSQKIITTFGNYAMAQLRRLQNALARDHYPDDEKEKHILNALNRQMTHFKNAYHNFEHGAISLYIDAKSKQILTDINLKSYPLRDMVNINSEMNNIIKDYSKLNSRNRKKTDYQLNKHAMHLIRLLMMGTEILNTGEINTFRKNDLDVLMKIKNGNMPTSDFYTCLNECETKFKKAVLNTSLPLEPDEKAVQNMMLDVYGIYYKTTCS